MPGIKTVCPFCDYITECIKPDCNDCPIRIEDTLNIDKQIAKSLKDYWACQQSGAEV